MGRKVDGLKDTLKNITGKEVVGETIGEVFENFNIIYKEVVATIDVKNSGGTAITGATIVVKTGSIAGSGDTITAEIDGTYKVKVGSYNYSVVKTSYAIKTGVFEVNAEDAKVGVKTIEVVIELV